MEENGRLLPLFYDDDGWRPSGEGGGGGGQQLYVGEGGEVVGTCLCRTGKANRLVYCLKGKEEDQDEWCYSVYSTQLFFGKYERDEWWT